ncbi:MAG: VOC family protein [Polaromonas sp.]|nr:VOC family protein [Polaromonas sp.]
MFKRIDHIELLTAQPERTISFYTDALGFHERERKRIADTPLGPLDLIYLELGGTTVEVMCYPEAKEISARSTKLHLGWQCLALEVNNMDAGLDCAAPTRCFRNLGTIRATRLCTCRNPRP